MRKLVIDHESTDDTADRARALGASVIVRRFEGFVAERKFGLSLVQTPWTLMIDADEALDETLRASFAACAGELDGYVLSRTTFFCGRPMRLWRNEPLLRLFRIGKAHLEARPAVRGGAQLHERWVSLGSCGSLEGTLLHDSYPDLPAYRRKFETYTSFEASGLEPSAAAAALAVFTFPIRLFWLLLVRRAALDGWRGAYVAWYSALYPLIVRLKALRGA